MHRVRAFIARRRFAIALLLVMGGGIFLYTYRLNHNPPGIFIDESSIAYNAYCIAKTGRDEHGIAWPLYFRAFGEYKNPVYIYVLAAIYRLTGPSTIGARLLSAVAVFSTALLLGLLCFNISRRRGLPLIVICFALLTPWLFELSRVILEV